MDSFGKFRGTLPQAWADDFAHRHQIGNPPNYLAHYTRVDVLQKIANTGELWLSNPLTMNDTRELRHGMKRAVETGRATDFGLPVEDRAPTAKAFLHLYADMDSSSALDVYYFCMSEYETGTMAGNMLGEPALKDSAFNDDGKLSMWRGYGGNGHGAAIIFKGENLRSLFPPCTIVGKVEYADDDLEQQRTDEIVKAFEADAKNVIGPDRHDRLATRLFNMFLLNSLFTKHAGFQEEQEWRAVYLGLHDEEPHRYDLMKHVEVTPRGLLPIVRLGQHAGLPSIKSAMHRVIAGPGLALPFSSRLSSECSHEASAPGKR